MKIITKNILEIEKGIICQSVNCQSVQGSGLAKQIKDKYPVVYREYSFYCSHFKHDFEILGSCQTVKINENLKIANIFGQLNYGHNGQYTEYCALKDGFIDLLKMIEKFDWKLEVYFPYLMACHRGGGDWKIVGEMIDYYFPNAIICKLPEEERCGIHSFVTKDKCGCK